MTHYPRTALIVEDDPATRKLLSIVLEREGLDVVALEAVPEAFKWLEQHCPVLAVLDVNLPGGTGFEIVQLIQDLYGNRAVSPVVFVVSGLRQEHNVLHGLRLGVAEYLTKPFSPLELVARVRRHLPEEELTNVFEAKATLNAPVQALSTQALSDSNFNPASFDDELNGIELETDVETSGTLELSARKPA